MLAITDLVWVEREVKHVARIKAEIRALRVNQAAHHESGNDEKHKRASDLHDDERGAKTTAAAGHGAAAIADSLDNPSTRSAERGHDADN